MNSSAKMTTFSFLAIAALGAAVFTGCTFSSGTNDDTDGGKRNDDTENPDPGDTDPKPNPDAGEAPVCETKQESEYIVTPECQACLDTSCCNALKTCFDIPADPDGELLECNSYLYCFSDCHDDEYDDEQREACFELCDELALPGVIEAYNAIEECGVNTCAAECG